MHLASAWATGLTVLCLGVGIEGAMSPLVPVTTMVLTPADDDTVMVEAFEPPAAAPAAETTEPEQPEEEEDIEIPPLPEITPPLTPPEMVELTPLEEVREPPPIPKPKPPEPAPKPKPVAKAVPKPARPPSSSANNTGGGGNGSAPVMFDGTGMSGGRYPKPPYPAAAQRARQAGTSYVLVTVEASGMPSSVSLSSSSGYAALDSAAIDTVRRRWRWPSGAVRKYMVPFRFVLP